ncbi:hypothetical protein GCM10027174_34110 [Salinifilum aidingensis]
MADEPGPHAGGPVRAALAAARDVRWRAPELAWAWCARAGAPEDGDWVARLETETLAAFAANRLGRPVTAAGRAVPVVRELPARHTAGPAADRILGELYVELAWCSGACGAPGTARRVLRSVLDSEVTDGLRAHALLAAAALPQPPAERVAALDESERLCSALPERAALPALARVAAERAVHWRRSGDFRAAAEAAESGLTRVEQLDDPAADSGAARGLLVLERVQALLELGAREQAEAIAAHAVRQPARAAAAPHLAWLGLVLATRVQAPRGDLDSAVRVLHDAAALAERYGLDAIGVHVQRALSHLHERADHPHAALRALRTAYAVDRRWRSAVHVARMRLCTEVPAALPAPASAVRAARTGTAAVGSVAARPAAPAPEVAAPEVAAPAGAVPDEPVSAGPAPAASADPRWEAVPAQRGQERSAAEPGRWSGRSDQHRSPGAESPGGDAVTGDAPSADLPPVGDLPGAGEHPAAGGFPAAGESPAAGDLPPAGDLPETGRRPRGRRRAAERDGHAHHPRSAPAGAPAPAGARRSRRSSTPAAEVLARYLPGGRNGGTGGGHRAAEPAAAAESGPAAEPAPAAAAEPAGTADHPAGPGTLGSEAEGRTARGPAAREMSALEAAAWKAAAPEAPAETAAAGAPTADRAEVPEHPATGVRERGAHAESAAGISALDIILSARAAESGAAEVPGGGRHAEPEPPAPEPAEGPGARGEASPSEEAPRWPRAVDLDTVIPVTDVDPGTAPAEPPVERVWPATEELAALADQAGAAPPAAGAGPSGEPRSAAEPPPPEALADQAGVAPSSGRDAPPTRHAQEFAAQVPAVPGFPEQETPAPETPEQGSEPGATPAGGPGPAEEVDPSSAGLADLLAGALAAFENTRGDRFDDTDPAGLPAQGAPVSISDLRVAENLRRGGEAGDAVLDGEAGRGPARRRRAGG